MIGPKAVRPFGTKILVVVKNGETQECTKLAKTSDISYNIMNMRIRKEEWQWSI